jgi:hypothetical protein
MTGSGANSSTTAIESRSRIGGPCHAGCARSWAVHTKGRSLVLGSSAPPSDELRASPMLVSRLPLSRECARQTASRGLSAGCRLLSGTRAIAIAYVVSRRCRADPCSSKFRSRKGPELRELERTWAHLRGRNTLQIDLRSSLLGHLITRRWQVRIPPPLLRKALQSRGLFLLGPTARSRKKVPKRSKDRVGRATGPARAGVSASASAGASGRDLTVTSRAWKSSNAVATSPGLGDPLSARCGEVGAAAERLVADREQVACDRWLPSQPSSRTLFSREASDWGAIAVTPRTAHGRRAAARNRALRCW